MATKRKAQGAKAGVSAKLRSSVADLQQKVRLNSRIRELLVQCEQLRDAGQLPAARRVLAQIDRLHTKLVGPPRAKKKVKRVRAKSRPRIE